MESWKFHIISFHIFRSASHTQRCLWCLPVSTLYCSPVEISSSFVVSCWWIVLPRLLFFGCCSLLFFGSIHVTACSGSPVGIILGACSKCIFCCLVMFDVLAWFALLKISDVCMKHFPVDPEDLQCTIGFSSLEFQQCLASKDTKW